MRIEAQTELVAGRADAWALLSEPHHLSDWWPGYTSVRPDRKGLAEGARWQVVRGGEVGLLKRPGGEGLIVVTAVEPERRLAWNDLEQGFSAEIRLEPAPDGNTRATLTVEASPWRAVAEGLRPLPRKALARLHALCQTAATL
ncbi:MAG TPA: SRPBCC family protein [Gaiellaceae bacterium]